MAVVSKPICMVVLKLSSVVCLTTGLVLSMPVQRMLILVVTLV